MEMIEEIVASHLEQMKRLRTLGMFHEEMRYCVGVISGLYAFEHEATTEFKDWAVDISSELANQILMKWTNSCSSPELMAEMKQFNVTSFREKRKKTS